MPAAITIGKAEPSVSPRIDKVMALEIGAEPVGWTNRVQHFGLQTDLDGPDPGQLGATKVTIISFSEMLTEDGKAAQMGGKPVRVQNERVTFDPVAYKGVTLTRADDSTFTVEQLMSDLALMAEAFKTGMPV